MNKKSIEKECMNKLKQTVKVAVVTTTTTSFTVCFSFLDHLKTSSTSYVVRLPLVVVVQCHYCYVDFPAVKYN